jgi:transposase
MAARLQITVSQSQVERLERWVKAGNTPQSIALRSLIILEAHRGHSAQAIGQTLKVSPPTIRLWKRRFLEGGPQALTTIAPGRGRKRQISRQKVSALVAATQHTKPPGQTPPDKAVVLCVDEKSQIQALARTQPGLPLKKGRCGTHTHDEVRHGSTTLFAALNVLDGKVIGQCLPRHRHQEFLKFLRTVDAEFPPEVERHLILDNYGTHKHPKVQQWLERRARFKLHFTPTSASWINLVERWFRELTKKGDSPRCLRQCPRFGSRHPSLPRQLQ